MCIPGMLAHFIALLRGRRAGGKGHANRRGAEAAAVPTSPSQSPRNTDAHDPGYPSLQTPQAPQI